MDEAERRAQIKRYLDYSGTDQDIAHEIYHDDAVLEFPQSRERFEGVENFRGGEASTRRPWTLSCGTCAAPVASGSPRFRSGTTVARGSSV